MRMTLFTTAVVSLLLSSQVWPPAVSTGNLAYVSLVDGARVLMSALLAMAGCLATLRLLGRLIGTRPT